MMTNEAAISLRPGEIRYVDIAPQIGDASSATVVAIDSKGVVTTATVTFENKWCATAWQRRLACPICERACGVLGVYVNGLACRRCVPKRTAQQKNKNTSSWRGEGSLIDEVIRSVVRERPPSSDCHVPAAVAGLLQRRAAATVYRAQRAALGMIAAADQLMSLANA